MSTSCEDLNGRRILIVGSTRGTGFAIASKLREQGAHIWVCGRDDATLEQAKQKLEARGTLCDVSEQSGRRKLVQELSEAWGALDALVLNVGSGTTSQPGLDCDDEEWLRVFQVNFFSHVALLREFLPILKLGQEPSVVSLSSIAGMTRLAAPLSYSAAKAALNQFCVSAAARLSDEGVRYNILAPGNIFYEGGRWEELRDADPQGVANYIESEVPMKRFASVEEVSQAVSFLLSNSASFCQGTILRVDGGQVRHG